jgi:hypothetical protein
MSIPNPRLLAKQLFNQLAVCNLVQRSACAPVPSLFSKKTLTIRINEKLSWLELRQRAQDAIPMFDCRHTAPGRSLKVINLMRAALEEAWAQL